MLRHLLATTPFKLRQNFTHVQLLQTLASRYAVIDLVLKLASYTYGPLLGLFTLGLATRVRLRGDRLPWVGAGAIALCAILDHQSTRWFGGYRFGFELLLLNALLTGLGAVALARTATGDPGTASAA